MSNALNERLENYNEAIDAEGNTIQFKLDDDGRRMYYTDQTSTGHGTKIEPGYHREVKYNYDRSSGIRFEHDSYGKLLDHFSYGIVEPFIETTIEAWNAGQEGDYTETMFELYGDEDVTLEEASEIIRLMTQQSSKEQDEDIQAFIETMQESENPIKGFFKAVVEGGVETGYKVVGSSLAGQAKAFLESLQSGGETAGMAVFAGGVGAGASSFGGAITAVGGFFRGSMSALGGLIEATSILGELIREEFDGRIPSEEELVNLTKDKSKWNEIVKKSIKKGGSIALTDFVLGTGVAKKTYDVAKKGGGANLMLAAVGGTAGEAFTGGFGEYISGEIIGRPSTAEDIALEIYGGAVAGTATDVAPSVLAGINTRYTITKPNGEKENVTLDQLNGILESADGFELAQMDIEVENDKFTDAKVKQAKNDAEIEVNHVPVTITETIDRLTVVELLKRKAELIKISEQYKLIPGHLERTMEKINDVDDQIQSVSQRYDDVDARTKPVRDIKEKKKAVGKYKFEKEFSSRAEFLRNVAAIYGGKLEEPMSQKEVDEYIANNPHLQGKGAETAGAFFDWRNNKVILNEDQIIKTKNWNADEHDVLHLILKSAVDENGESLITEEVINDLKKVLGPDNWKVIEDAQKIKGEDGKQVYTDEYMAKNRDEYLTLISDGIRNGKIKYDKTIFDRIKNIIEPIIGDYLTSKIPFLTRTIGFENGEQVFNLLLEYNKSIEKGAISQAILNNIKPKDFESEEVKGDKDVVLSKVEPVEVNLEESKSDLDKYITDDIKTQDDFKKSGARDKVFTEIYSNNALDGVIRNKLIRDKRFGGIIGDENTLQNIIDDIKFRLLNKMDSQYKPIVDGKVRSIFSYFYGDKTGRGGAIGYVIEDVAKAYKQTPDTSKSIEVKTDEGVKTIDVEDEIDQDIDIDERNVLEENIAELKGIDPLDKKDGFFVKDEFGFDDDVVNIIDDTIEETNYDPESNYEDVKKDITSQEKNDVDKKTGKPKYPTVKSKVDPTGPLFAIIDAVANLVFGVDPKAVMADPQNLTTGESTNSRTKIAELMKDIGVKKVLELVLPKTQFNPKTGKSIGISKTLLDNFYIDGVRVPNIKGKVRNLDNMTNNEILEVFGINPNFTLMDHSRKYDGPIKGFIIQTAVVAGNQSIRKEDQSASIGIGKPEIVFSVKEVENAQNIIDNPRFDTGEKSIKHLLNKYEQELYELKNETDVDAFIEELKKNLLPLMPKGFWFGPRGGSTFKASSKIMGKGMSKNPLWKYYTGKINDIFEDGNQKYGEPIKGVDNFSISSYKTLFKDEATIKKNIKNGKIDEFNEKVAKIHKEFWKRFNEAIKSDKKKAGVIGTYLKMVGSDTKHWHKLGAQFVGYSTNPKMRYEYEHAMPATAAYLYLMDLALSGGNFEAGYNAVIDNYKLIALDKAMDNKLRDAGLQRKMPKNWNLVDNLWWERYFNGEVSKIKRGINPNSIIGLDGKSFAETLGIKSDGNPTVIKPSKSDIKKNQNIIEANNNIRKSVKPQGMSTFDFDETLIIDGENFVIATNPETGEKIKIKSGEWPTKGPELAAQGYTFNFDDFVNVRGGVDGPLLQKMKNQIKKYGPKNVFVLTARPQSADVAIHEWLKSKGINIPLNNITGLADSRGQAKADWMVEKFAEGYNDMYFVDDALPNVKAVKNVLDQLDIKSKVVQAEVKFSKNLNKDFNEMLERTSGIDAKKTFSEAEAFQRGKGKGKFDWFVPPSAEDFKGLMYRFLGRGEQGNKDMQWIKDNLFSPYAKAYSTWNAYKQQMANDYAALKKKLPNVIKDLNKKIPGTNFTTDSAIRVYLWDKAGFDIPGLARNTKRKLINHVKGNKDIKNFADALGIISKVKEGYIKPEEYWYAETIANDLNKIVNTIGRESIFSKWKENIDVIFSPENLNKIEAIYGSNYRNELEKMLYRMETGKNRITGKDSQVNRFLNWINGSVGAVMFMNMRSAGLQTMSMVNFINWSDNNIFKAAKAFANQPQFWSDFSTIFNSDMLKQRRAGLQIDVSASELTKAFKDSQGKPQAIIAYLLEKGFAPTRIADSFAIAMGGASFYRNRIDTYTKQGMSIKDAEKQAFLDFQEIAEETQQSSRPDLISNQQAGPLGRLVLAWQNTPMQYTRLTKKALSDIANGRGDMKLNTSKLIYYGIAQNIMFSALQTGLAFTLFGSEIEDDELKKREIRVANSALDSFVRGTGVYGSVAVTIKNTLIQWDYERNQPYGKRQDWRIMREAVSLSPPMGSKYRKIMNAIKTEQYNKGVSEQIGLRIENPNLSVIANMTEGLTNFPLGRIVNKANNLEEAFTGNHELWQRVALTAGWNKWDIGIKDEELEEAKSKAKIKRAEDKKKIKEEKKLEEKARKEKEGIKTVQCSGVRSNGERCKLTTETKAKTWKCPHHKEFKDGMDRDGDGVKEYRCTAIKTDGKRCNNKTENKNKKCYAHQ